MLPDTPQNSVVDASDTCPSLSRHSSALQRQKSGSSASALRGMGCICTPVFGMCRLNQAASTYTSVSAAMAACGALPRPSVCAVGICSSHCETAGPTSCPPSSTPRMMEQIVSPSIQPLARTSCEGGSSSVRMPYLAGE